MPSGLGLIAIIGAALLFLVYIFVIRKNQKSDVPIERTEKATHELYEEEHEAAERRENEV